MLATFVGFDRDRALYPILTIVIGSYYGLFDNGSIYRCKLRLAAGGAKLVVRGFRGISLLGRSQTWEREP